MDKTNEIIGERVKRLRKSLKLTQFQLAKKSTLAVQTIKDIEQNLSPGGAKSYKELARVFGISIEELTGEGEKPEARVELRELPPSLSLRKYLSVPDRVVELATILGLGNSIWENEIIPLLEAAVEDMEIDLQKKNSQRA